MEVIVTCPGLHCPGCSGAQSLGIVGGAVVGLVVAAETVTWVAEHIWEIGLTVTACFALAVAASMWLERWADRRGARFAAAHGILSRADVILPAPGRVTAVTAQPEQPGLTAPQITVNIFGATEPEQAAILRKMLPASGEEIP
jgi:hypothetical protein